MQSIRVGQFFEELVRCCRSRGCTSLSYFVLRISDGLAFVRISDGLAFDLAIQAGICFWELFPAPLLLHGLNHPLAASASECAACVALKMLYVL